MPYKRLSRFSRYFVSPQFWPFGWKLEFFNSHRPFHSKPSREEDECNRDVTSVDPKAACRTVLFCPLRQRSSKPPPVARLCIRLSSCRLFSMLELSVERKSQRYRS